MLIDIIYEEERSSALPGTRPDKVDLGMKENTRPRRPSSRPQRYQSNEEERKERELRKNAI